MTKPIHPIKLLFSVLEAGEIPKEGWDKALESYRFLVVKTISDKIWEEAQDIHQLVSLFPPVKLGDFAETLRTDLERFTPYFNAKISAAKKQEVYEESLLSALLDMIEVILKESPPRIRDKIGQVLDGDPGFKQLYLLFDRK